MVYKFRYCLGILAIMGIFVGLSTQSPARAFQSTATSAPTDTSGWTFVDPRDPSLPELIAASSSGYQLSSKWSVTKIEYLFTHSPDGAYDYQAIERVDSSYVKDKKFRISTAPVNRLLQAINKLQLTEGIVVSNTHSDDYPSWEIDLTGEDGQHISLYSQSTDTAGQSPWNVLYNGRLYVQFDSDIGKAIFQLFTIEQYDLNGVVVPEHRANTMEIYAYELPAPLKVGFVGLLPFADSFTYQIDRTKGEIKGSILSGDSTDWVNSVFPAPALPNLSERIGGKLNRIATVELTLTGDQKLACTPADKTWEFTCKLPSIPDQRYLRIPIRVTLSANNGKQMTTEGELRRGWPETAILKVSLSDQVQPALMANPVIADLATDHVIRINYNAMRYVDGSQAPAIDAKAKLFGQMSVNGAMVRYVVATYFVIHSGKLEDWSLSRDALKKMLGDITASALFKRAQSMAPDLVVSISYDTATLTSPDIPESSALTTGTSYPACGDRPAVTLPNADQPIQRFSFNRLVTFDDTVYYYPADFVLIDHKPYADDLYYRPDQETTKIGALLTPPELVKKGLEPFAQIQLGSSTEDPSYLYLEVSDKTDANVKSEYEQIIKSLPGKAESRDETSWRIHGVTLQITEDGTLRVQSCTGH